ncbi:MAG: dTMP kinase [Verrucomicrobia bacterium]|nr:dTMP kinase [Verrucomicrobiota bacterium]MBU4291423.1 dTMP kinase [Verrucomicrobiota bacterium]
MRRGKFITLEGPEGSGKSTHARTLVARMTQAGFSVIAAREPGGTRLGEAIRKLLQQDAADEPLGSEAELFLFMASRAQLVQQVILPALAKGIHVVCDRFADSTSAYQGYGRGVDLDRILMINDLAVQGLMPDVTLLLDIPVAIGFERLQVRNADANAQKDRIEREALGFHERVRDGYLDLARRWPDRIRRIDTSGVFSEVNEELWRVVKRVIDG